MVMPFEDMLQKIQPRQHCAWFKALLNLLQCCSPTHTRDADALEYLTLPIPQAPRSLRHNMSTSTSTSALTSTDGKRERGEKQEKQEGKGKDKHNKSSASQHDFTKYQYVLWIDADAAVINPQQSLQSFIQQAPPCCDLLISEDMGGEEGGSTCSPVNTGESEELFFGTVAALIAVSLPVLYLSCTCPVPVLYLHRCSLSSCVPCSALLSENYIPLTVMHDV